MKGVLLPVAGMVLLACGSAWADSKTVKFTLRILVGGRTAALYGKRQRGGVWQCHY